MAAIMRIKVNQILDHFNILYLNFTFSLRIESFKVIGD